MDRAEMSGTVRGLAGKEQRIAQRSGQLSLGIHSTYRYIAISARGKRIFVPVVHIKLDELLFDKRPLLAKDMTERLERMVQQRIVTFER